MRQFMFYSVLAYPAMLTFVPSGLLGIVVASLFGALLSTLASHLNWGASYVVNDFYKRFVNPHASEKQMVRTGRISTVTLMVMSCVLAPFLESAKTAFDLVLQIGAGTGLLFLMRWFWWRINAFSEITAMAMSFLVAVFFQLVYPHLDGPVLAQWQKLIIGIVITTVSWVAATLLTNPTNDETLFRFCRLIRAGGPGWKAVEKRAEALGTPLDGAGEKGEVPSGLLCMVLSCLAVYATMFAIGSWFYSYVFQASCMTAVALLATVFLFKVLARLYVQKEIGQKEL